MSTFKYLGYGLGLRAKHYETILETKPTEVDWFEAVTEDYLVPGGVPLYYLEAVRKLYPVVLHGVSMSIGSCDPLDWNYLKQLKQLIERIDPAWVSDHLCWTGINGTNLHDLMPLPYTEEALHHVAQRISQVQDYLGRQILIENPSSYVDFTHSEMTEWGFLTRLVKESGCLVLLDVNNIYVSAFNHSFDAQEYLNNIPVDCVQQIHMAGHLNKKDVIIDTHDDEIIKEVYDLYADAVRRFGRVSTMIERDDNIPDLDVLLKELDQLKQIAENIHEEESDAVAA